MKYAKNYKESYLLKRSINRFIATLITLTLISSIFTVQVFAKTYSENRDSLENAVYLTSNRVSMKASKSIGIYTETKDNIASKTTIEADVVIVDFEDIYYDSVFATEVAEQIQCGKVFYIRATGYSANTSIIANTLNISDDSGIIREAKDNKIYARMGSFGYMVFVNGRGHLQIVRQLVGYTDITDCGEEIVLGTPSQLSDSEPVDFVAINGIKEAYENAPEFTLSDEMDAIDSFLDAHSPTDIGKSVGTADEGFTAQASFTSYAYEKLYDTTYWYGYVRTSSSSTTYYKKIGAITRAMYAERLYCATANWSNPAYLTSKWAYMSDVYMQPTWNQSTTYRSLNRNLFVSYSTWPTGSGNATYKMILRDYIPKVDLSGKTDVTISVGADATASGSPGLSGSAGFSATTSYADVGVEVPIWQVGLSYSNNCAQIKFTIGGSTFLRLTPKTVMKSTIALTSGVVLWNYADKYSCIQLDYTARWYINNGLSNLNDIHISASSGVVWQPANLY